MAGSVLAVNTEFPSEEIVTAVSSVIKTGGIAVYPSDTVYGLMADGFNKAACEAVASIKGYSSIRPFIILVNSLESALSLVSSTNGKKLMQLYWPGPVTLVFKASNITPPWLVSTNGTVALRYPADNLSQAILRETGRFLITTSANTKGQPFPLVPDNIHSSITDFVDLMLDGGVLPARTPSKVLNCTGETPVEVRK